MCGRYASTSSFDELVDDYDIADLLEGLPGPDWNVAPTVAVPAVYERVDKESGQTRRRLGPLTWGLVPSWAKERSIGAKMINARVESVAEKPAYRKAFVQRRCVLPADGYYEWYTSEAPDAPRKTTGKGNGKPVKQPFFIHRADGRRLSMAGLYEIWRDPSKPREDDSAWLRTCTVITTRATDAVGHIHDRMPMVIADEDVSAWLDPQRTDADAALQLLHVTEPEQLAAYAVSTDVNSVANNDAHLVEPLPDADEPGAGEPAGEADQPLF